MAHCCSRPAVQATILFADFAATPPWPKKGRPGRNHEDLNDYFAGVVPVISSTAAWSTSSTATR
jgi:hypothetical protein